MGSPQTSTEPVTDSAPATEMQAAVGPAATLEAPASVSSQAETELRAEVATLKSALESLKSSISGGLHNRVNELERIIKSKFPYA
jgi:hypothetical protein